jgi:hypothetical protein
MKNKQYSVSMQVPGQREEVAKTSWKKKRGTIQIVDQHKYGSNMLDGGDGAATHDTTNRMKTIDVGNSSFHDRNLSIKQSTLHESTANMTSNMRKLEPIAMSIAKNENMKSR